MSHTVPLQSEAKSGSPIDVLIPAIEKDLGTLPHVIEAIRRHVRHPIGTIRIVAPDSPRIRALCRRKGCRFVDERSVLPITKQQIPYRTRKWDRTGWLYQQLLKLSGDTLTDRDAYLVVDADTVFIRPHRFRDGPKTVFYCRSWTQPEYLRTYRRLLGKRPPAPSSFVTHYMLFKTATVRRLKRAIEAKHGMPWYRAIIRSMNRASPYAFSEYETYGNFLYTLHPEQVVLRTARNKSLSGRIPALSGQRVRQLAARYRSLSFHHRKMYFRAKSDT